MKELSKKQITAIAVCICSALLSVVVMINQISLTERTADILAANSKAASQETSRGAENNTSMVSNLNSHETTTDMVETEEPVSFGKSYVINKNSKMIHSKDCRYAENMKPENREELTTDNLDELLKNGYSICSVCEAQ